MKSAGRIMVVDDEEATRAALNECFTNAGYEVVVAGDGEEALRKFLPGKFDCVIAGLAMPAIDGPELLRRIRLLDADAAFLVTTALPGLDGAISAIREGAYDYITKPFHWEDLQLKVERALSVRKTEQSLKKVNSLIVTLVILIPVMISVGIIFGIFWKGAN